MVDTVASYRSPVRLVLHAAEAISPFSPQAIGRARKKLMAEIALGGDEVVLDGISYSRNDASALLDGLSEEAWRMHCLVYTYPGLLDFLEKQSFNNEELKKADAYLYDQRFINGVSPFFAYSFNVVAGQQLRQADYESLLQLLQYKSYVLPEHHHEAFQRLRNYLGELTYTLRNLSWEKFIADESILHFVFSSSWRKMLNALPSSFNTLRDEVVDQIIQLVLRFQQKATWFYLHQLLTNLRELDTNDFNRHEIDRIDEVIYANTKIESKKGVQRKDGEVSSGRIVWWGVWVVLMIVRMATCNDRSSTNYNFSPDRLIVQSEPAPFENNTERTNEKALLMQLGNELGKKKLAVQPDTIKSGDVAFAFSDDPHAAINDSLLVENKTAYDAVVFYFKDVPGHALSGRLPKLYTAFVKKGEQQMIYLLPGNGRIYFAFGNGWGTLKKPFTVVLPEENATVARPRPYTLQVDHFFSNSPSDQRWLSHALYVGERSAPRSVFIRPLNKDPRPDERRTILTLSQSTTGISLLAKGRLPVTAEGTEK